MTDEIASGAAPSKRPPTRFDRRPRRAIGAVAIAGAASIALLAVGGFVASRRAPSRCVAGFSRMGPRCCGEGQAMNASRCTGTPRRCGGALVASPDGCVAPESTIAIAGATLGPAAVSWQADARAASTVKVEAFRIDTYEVTRSRFAKCVGAGACMPPIDEGASTGEPGLPVVDVSAFDAARFCAFANGSLPSSAQFRLAAGGPDGRKFPWGPAGAVCRKATWGMVSGPCARAGSPELAGARPEGRSPEGVEDLSGNVAEWTAPLPDGMAEVRGGSFVDVDTAALTSSSARLVRADFHASDIGFRCVYVP